MQKIGSFDWFCFFFYFILVLLFAVHSRFLSLTLLYTHSRIHSLFWHLKNSLRTCVTFLDLFNDLMAMAGFAATVSIYNQTLPVCLQ